MDSFAEQLHEHRSYLWAVCYRLTGDVSDAEDLVQNTFARALERPPADLERSLRPWLTKVASNLAIDLLRRRKLQSYDGPWLPAPIEALVEVDGFERSSEDAGPDDEDPEQRYAQLESASYAFLLALELLEPNARAVLVLRDVLGYSGPEVAQMLELSPGNVRVLLHRARKLLAEHDVTPGRRHRGAEHDARLHEVFGRFLAAIADGDAERLAALLREDVLVRNDAAGEYKAARKLIYGRESVVKLLLGITQGRPLADWAELREVNGEPALVAVFPLRDPKFATRSLTRLELDEQGAIREVQLIVASRKLQGITFQPRGG